MNFITSEEFYYSQNGEWVQVDENLVTVGLTDFRLDQLGEVLFLDLPEEGKLVRQGEAFFSVESVKQIHDLISPVSGTIVEVNQDLYENPNRLNDEPFGEGWVIRIEMENEKDLATLMRASEYKQRIGLKASAKNLEVYDNVVEVGSLGVYNS
ncbi:MAG: glycine cleavage system protein GcvH [Pseudobdellovibrionaceae bacterium]